MGAVLCQLHIRQELLLQRITKAKDQTPNHPITNWTKEWNTELSKEETQMANVSSGKGKFKEL